MNVVGTTLARRVIIGGDGGGGTAVTIPVF